MTLEEGYTDYDAFAWTYKRHWSREVPPDIWTVLEKMFVPRLPRGARVLDLCCGTGYTVAELSRRGFEVTGLDASKEMLRYARRLAPSARFVHADARAFELPPVYRGVVSTFDSLNHLMSLEDLTAAFRNVHRALAPAGLFFFDMNMEKAFLRHWVDFYSIVERDHACVLRGEYDRKTKLARYDITMFRLSGEVWRRADTSISERCYTPAEIRRALRQAGFGEITTYDADKELGLTEHVGRRFFLARKDS